MYSYICILSKMLTTDSQVSTPQGHAVIVVESSVKWFLCKVSDAVPITHTPQGPPNLNTVKWPVNDKLTIEVKR